jgi:hypothetical protein
MPKQNKDEIKLLEEIRDLLILISTKVGASNSEVAKVLDCGESTLRKKVSFSGGKKNG